MKKHKKTIISMLVLLLVLFVLIIVNKQKKNSGSGDTSELEDMIQRINSSGLDFVSMGDTAAMEDIDYTILSAECQPELQDNDGYYSQRGKIEPEIEFWSDPENLVVIYKEELTYTYVTVELKNNSDSTKVYQNTDLRLYNIKEKKVEEFFDLCDWRTWDEKGEEIEWDFMLEPEETVKLELFYVTFLPSSYDLYLGITKPIANGKSYLCLSLNLLQTEKKERDLALLRAQYGTTNYDIASAQEEGSVILDKYFYESGETVGPFVKVEEMAEIYDSKKYTILDVDLIDDYDKIPESFKKRVYLQEMTKTYQERYNFTEQDLQYLFVTARLEQFQNIEETIPVTVSQAMWLYNKREDNTIWKIGYPDDYEVSDSENAEAVHMDTYEDSEGDVHYITAAYIIWPGILQDVYLWTADGAVREGDSNSYAKESIREQGGGIHVELP